MKFSIKGKNLFCACVIVCGILTGCSSENPAAGNDGPAVVPPSEIYRMSLYATGNRKDGYNHSNLAPCRFTTEKGGLNSAHFEYEGEIVDSRYMWKYGPMYTKTVPRDYDSPELTGMM